mgnify:FL=1
MQRKNNFLMPLNPVVRNIFCTKMFTVRRNSFRSTPARPAMAMIMALVVIVTLATIMALSLSMTAETTKRTTDVYLHEQAILVSKSAAELALLDIAEYGPCTTEATLGTTHLGAYRMDLDNDGVITDDIYDVNVTVRYVYDGLNCGGTNDYATVTTDEQNGSVLMDITVTTDEGTEPIRYFRRSIQKL